MTTQTNIHTVRRRRETRHDAAVTQAEVRRLALALAPFRVLSRDALKERVSASDWHEGSFEHALRSAVDSGVLKQLPGDFYEEVR